MLKSIVVFSCFISDGVRGGGCFNHVHVTSFVAAGGGIFLINGVAQLTCIISVGLFNLEEGLLWCLTHRVGETAKLWCGSRT